MIILERKCLLEGATGSSNYRESEMSETYYIKYDTVVFDASEAIRHCGFLVGAEHPNNIWFSLASIEADAISGQEWIIALNYNTDQTNDNQSDVDFKTDVRHGKWTFNRVVAKDKETGEPIVNTAGELFDSPIIEEVACPIISVSRRRTSPEMNLLELVGSINSTAFTLVGVDIPKYCAQLSDYTIERGLDQDQNSFYIQTFEFKLNFTKSIVTGQTIGFKAEVANVGFRVSKGVDKFADITYQGSPITAPAFLNEDGTSGTSTANYKQFVINDLVNFSSLNLPTRYPNY